MKKISLIIFAAFGLVIFSCKKSDSNNSNSRSCAFGVGPISAGFNGTVKYEISLEGTGQVTQAVIKKNGVDSSIKSPTLPFEISLPFTNGQAVGISATGTTSGGTIKLQYELTPSGGGSLIKDEASCGN
jgi:hypothetical protein